MNSNLEEFLSGSRHQCCVDGLFSLYASLLENHGYDYFAYAIISDHPTLAGGDDLGLLDRIELNGWEDYYGEHNYIEIDPVHKICCLNPGVVIWRDVVEQNVLSPQQSQLFNEAESAGLRNGVTISVHGPNGTKASAVLASSQSGSSLDALTGDTLNLASHQFHLCLLALMKHQTEHVGIKLSSREREVLTWLAAGLTKSEVGERLNISSHTVDYHMRNTLGKLGARNSTAAIAIAIQHNLIRI